MTLRGIDISSYQRGLDVSSPSVDFCIVKSTEGTYQVQDTCDPWLQRLIELGRLWGFYHVMSSEDGTSQADFYLDNCINYFRHGIPILDIEGISSKYPNNPGIAYDFCRRVIDETGVVPMVYMNSACLRGADWTRVRDLGCGLWIANYYRSGLDYDSADPSSMMSDPTPWPFAAMWQFSSTGRVDGWGKSVDMDLFFGDADAWRKYAGVNDSGQNVGADYTTLEGGGYRVTIERTE